MNLPPDTIMILFTGGKLGQQSVLKLENEAMYQTKPDSGPDSIIPIISQDSTKMIISKHFDGCQWATLTQATRILLIDSSKALLSSHEDDLLHLLSRLIQDASDLGFQVWRSRQVYLSCKVNARNARCRQILITSDDQQPEF
jgi:hypothetical protein